VVIVHRRATSAQLADGEFSCGRGDLLLGLDQQDLP
jgi:hypothetical protein